MDTSISPLDRNSDSHNYPPCGYFKVQRRRIRALATSIRTISIHINAITCNQWILHVSDPIFHKMAEKSPKESETSS